MPGRGIEFSRKSLQGSLSFENADRNGYFCSSRQAVFETLVSSVGALNPSGSAGDADQWPATSKLPAIEFIK